MPTRTADSLVFAAMTDTWPSMAAVVDFGVTQTTYPAYQKAIRRGLVSNDQLHQHAGDDAWLSQTIGVEVKTLWSQIGNENDD